MNPGSCFLQSVSHLVRLPDHSFLSSSCCGIIFSNDSDEELAAFCFPAVLVR